MKDTPTNNMGANTPAAPRVYVVFTGKTDIWWLRLLRKNYRHCFVIMNDGHRWISIDPLSSYTDILVHHVPPDFDFPAWMQKRGYTVVAAHIYRPHRAAPFGVFTCVEAVKRILGIHKRRLITPYQLYKYLNNERQTTMQHPAARQNLKTDNFMKGDLSWEA